MMDIGRIQKLKIDRIVPKGAYLKSLEGESNQSVLLPNKEVTEDLEVGQSLDVFVYRDFDNKLVATLKEPLAQVGEVGYLEVVKSSNIGAFLDMGLDKDVLLPFKEQRDRIKEGQKYLVALYVDKSNRLSATMNVEPYLKTHGDYEENQWAKGVIYDMSKDLGAFVAVDNAYMGLIYKDTYFRRYRIGDEVDVRVKKVREDGKLDLSVKEKAYKQMDIDAERIIHRLEHNNGYIKLNDKSDPVDIKRQLHMSKSSFKRAIGRLFKQGKIEITEDGIYQK